MKPYKEREEEANAVYAWGMHRVKTTPAPKGQKFPVGCRVKIADDLGEFMKHFPAGNMATVEFTHAHAFDSSDTDSYSLDIDGIGSVAWYKEDQLTEIKNDGQPKIL